MKLTEVQQRSIQARMSMIVGAENYDRLFLGAEFSEVDDKILYVFAPSESLAAEIEEQFSLHLSIVAGQVMFDEQDTAPGSASLSVCGKGTMCRASSAVRPRTTCATVLTNWWT
jgi:hypothetical protein